MHTIVQDLTHTTEAPNNTNNAQQCLVLLFDNSLNVYNTLYAETTSTASETIDRLKHILIESGFKGNCEQLRSFSGAHIGFEHARVVCVGIGELASPVIAPLQQCGKKIMQHCNEYSIESIVLPWLSDETACANTVFEAVVLGLQAAHYSFTRYLSKKKTHSVKTLQHYLPKTWMEATLLPLLCALQGQTLAKDLMHEPANVLTPAAFAHKMLELEADKLKVTILDKKALEEENMHALLSVGQASVYEPQLVIIEWCPQGQEQEHPVALVGKGICFDSGGINLKPSKGLEEMKYDMGGAAAVAGTMLALARNNCKKRVVGILALAENSVHGNAMRPSDIITSRQGKSICVLNTDAEGRLILADALDYVQDKYSPCAIVDLATLTGAIIIALGTHRAGLFSNNDTLANALTDASNKSHEQLWRLPLDSTYDKMMDSPIADVQNLGTPDRAAGSITAAQFLQRFIKNTTPWAHLDIAGTGFKGSDPLHGKGPTGYGVWLLFKAINSSTPLC